MYTKLIELLRKSEIPYTKLAKMIGMPISTMWYKYHGLTSFSLEEALKIKEVLNAKMPVEELFKRGGKENDS